MINKTQEKKLDICLKLVKRLHILIMNVEAFSYQKKATEFARRFLKLS